MFSRLASKSLLGLIRTYQRYLSRTLAKRLRCRFYPTCSNYGVLAIEKHGAWKGLGMTLNRWSRCRPDNWESCVDLP